MTTVLDTGQQADRQKTSGELSAALEGDAHLPEFEIRLDKVERLICHPRPEGRIVGQSRNHAEAAEKFRLLRHRLEQLRRYRPISSLLITSTIPREGKSMVAVNLAATLAMTSSRVLLVDADLRKPAVHAMLGIGRLPGMAETLTGGLRLNAALRRVEPLGFYYLPAGRTVVNPAEVLGGPRTRGLVKESAACFEWVILDSPPLLPFADSHCLAAISDAVLVVAREGLTPRDELRRTVEALKNSWLAGIVLNGTTLSQRESYYSYYTSDSAAPAGRAPNPVSTQQPSGRAPKNG